MVNLMYQLDWATGWPDIWLNIISGSVTVFLENRIWIADLNKTDGSLLCGWASSHLLRAQKDKKVAEGWILSTWLSWEMGLLLLDWGPDLPTQMGTLPRALQLSGLWTIPLAFLSLRLAEGRLWNFSNFHYCMSQFLYVFLIYVRLCFFCE